MFYIYLYVVPLEQAKDLASSMKGLIGIESDGECAFGPSNFSIRRFCKPWIFGHQSWLVFIEDARADGICLKP